MAIINQLPCWSTSARASLYTVCVFSMYIIYIDRCRVCGMENPRVVLLSGISPLALLHFSFYLSRVPPGLERYWFDFRFRTRSSWYSCFFLCKLFSRSHSFCLMYSLYHCPNPDLQRARFYSRPFYSLQTRLILLRRVNEIL